MSGDAEQTEIAALLQAAFRRWLVIWSAWRRTYTGFACFTERAVVIDEALVDRFVARLVQAESAVTTGAPHSGRVSRG